MLNQNKKELHCKQINLNIALGGIKGVKIECSCQRAKIIVFEKANVPMILDRS